MAENRELALVLKLVADQFQSELKKSQGALGSFNNFIKDWKTQLTAAGTALFAIAKSTANFGEEALKGAQKAGQTVETFTALSYAAKLADIDQQQLIVSLKSLSQNMVEAARQTGDGEAVFRRLGVSALTASGQLRPTEQVLLDLAEVFANSADGAGKTEVAVKLFGKAGMDLIPFLNQGKAGISALMSEASRLGVVLSKEDAEAANAFNDAIKRLESANRGLTLQLGGALLPTLTDSLEGFTKLIVKVKELGSETSNVSQNLKNMSDAFGQTKIGQGLMDVFTAMGFGHRKGEGTLPREQFWFDLLGMPAPGSGVLAPSGGGAGGESGGVKPPISQVPDQEKIGKALLEIHLAMNRAIDIENKLRTEGVDIYRLQTDRAEQRKQEDDAYQEHLGRLIVEQTQLQVSINDKARVNERDGLIENLKAWQEYGEKIGGSTEFILAKRLDLVRAELGKELDVTTETAGRLLIAWQNNDEDALQSLRARIGKTEQELETSLVKAQTRYRGALNDLSGDFFDGWASGMRNYVKDTSSGFGLAADMARRSFQTIEQSASRFFFDAMEGRITRFKDVLNAFLNFTKQIASQFAGQLITKQLAVAFTGNVPLGAAQGGLIQRFATGGPVLGFGNQDTVPALLTPGEFVLSRRDVSDIKSGLSGGLNVIVNNYGSSEVQTSTGRGPDGRQALYVTVREAVKGMVRGGELDAPMSQRYGVNPAPGRR